jgi:Fur family ferric uptake transcriptional regulator
MEQAYRVFADYITENGLKFTPQRRLIARVFLAQSGHLSTEELYDKVRVEDPAVGQATVYRTLKLLCGSGLAREEHFGDGVARYEVLIGHDHHDHLICTSCNRRIEAVDPAIEKLQEELARRNGFKLISHYMYLYGICAACQKKGAKKKK